MKKTKRLTLIFALVMFTFVSLFVSVKAEAKSSGYKQVEMILVEGTRSDYIATTGVYTVKRCSEGTFVKRTGSSDDTYIRIPDYIYNPLTTDGKSLIYIKDHIIYRCDMATGQTKAIKKIPHTFKDSSDNLYIKYIYGNLLYINRNCDTDQALFTYNLKTNKLKKVNKLNITFTKGSYALASMDARTDVSSEGMCLIRFYKNNFKVVKVLSKYSSPAAFIYGKRVYFVKYTGRNMTGKAVLCSCNLKRKGKVKKMKTIKTKVNPYSYGYASMRFDKNQNVMYFEAYPKQYTYNLKTKRWMK